MKATPVSDTLVACLQDFHKRARFVIKTKLRGTLLDSIMQLRELGGQLLCPGGRHGVMRPTVQAMGQGIHIGLRSAWRWRSRVHRHNGFKTSMVDGLIVHTSLFRRLPHAN
jgi:hypothetical protein